MFDISKFIVQILESIMYIYITYQLLNRKLTFKTAIISGIILAIFWRYSYLLGNGVIQNLLVYRMLMLLIVYIATRINILKVLITVFVSLNVSIMIEYLSLAQMSMILNIPIQPQLEEFIFVITYSISFIIGCIFYLILKKYNLHLFDSSQNDFSVETIFSQNSKKLTRLKGIFNDSIIIILVVVLQMTLVTDYFYSIEFFESYDTVELRTFILCITLLFLNIMTLFLVKKVQKAREDIHLSKIKEIEFSKIEMENKIVKQYKHDLFNHFGVLSSLLEKKKYDEAQEYLVNYHEDVKSNIISIKTGLKVLDILLHSKINKAQENNIKVDYKCYTNIQCNKVNVVDFISIISNLLDNAIEASQISEKKVLRIYIDKVALDYVFTIENTFNDNEILASDILLKEGFSTKGPDRGIGLKIVNKLVKKYDGSIKFNKSTEFFKVEVALPKHELKRS